MTLYFLGGLNRVYMDLVEQFGVAALWIAVEKGHHRCVSVLVANGADVNVGNEVTAYDMGGWWMALSSRSGDALCLCCLY